MDGVDFVEAAAESNETMATPTDQDSGALPLFTISSLAVVIASLAGW